MRVLVTQLAETLQYANLCILPVSVMVELDISPGNLILLSSLDNRKRSLVRVMGNRTTTRDTYANKTCPVIEIDENLIKYLEISENDEVELSRENEADELSWVCFETTKELDNNKVEELKKMIKSAKWPVYRGAFFSLNMENSPVNLIVTDLSSDTAVICTSTIISILSPQESEKLKIQDEIMSAKIALSQIRKDQRSVDTEKNRIEKEINRLDREAKATELKIRRLRDEISNIHERIKKIPDEQKELLDTIHSLQQEKRSLEDELTKLVKEHSEIGSFNLGEIKNTCLEKENNVKELLKQCEHTITKVLSP